MPAQLEQLLASGSSDPAVLGSALGLAFFLGSAHALTPGHGKTIVAAYLIGSRGRVSDAVWLGSMVTLTHTATVFGLGLAALFAAQRVPMAQVYPWFSLASGALIFGMGLWLLRSRLHQHSHSHHHDHTHDHEHSHPTRGSLLSLGISGGIVPCPEALVVLMISFSIGRPGFGLALLIAFSLGLAAVLIAIGVAMVLATPLMRRFTGETRWTRVIPVASAVVITIAGAAMLAQALGQVTMRFQW